MRRREKRGGGPAHPELQWLGSAARAQSVWPKLFFGLPVQGKQETMQAGPHSSHAHHPHQAAEGSRAAEVAAAVAAGQNKAWRPASWASASQPGNQGA